MSIEYRKAKPGDYEELIDLASYVFSFAYNPTDFLTLLPKLYAKEQFVPECHYIVKEEGRIRALIGSYPMCYQVCGQSLKVAGIGAVTVHHYSRSKGYMKALMEMALEDMKRDGVHLACLCGLRQRYEYFGFTPCGVKLSYEVSGTNIRHHCGKDFTPSVELREIDGSAEIEAVWRAHHAKEAHIERPLARLPLILRSWGDRCTGVWKEGTFAGYCVASKDKRRLFEVNLEDDSLLPDLIAAYLDGNGVGEVRVVTYSHEASLVRALSAFAEKTELSEAYNFNVLDFPAVLSAFLKLKGKTAGLPEGQVTLRIRGYQDITISVSGGEAVVSTGSGEPDLTLNRLEAMRLLFSPVTLPPEHPFLRALLPIPLFLEESDKI